MTSDSREESPQRFSRSGARRLFVQFGNTHVERDAGPGFETSNHSARNSDRFQIGKECVHLPFDSPALRRLSAASRNIVTFDLASAMGSWPIEGDGDFRMHVQVAQHRLSGFLVHEDRQMSAILVNACSPGHCG